MNNTRSMNNYENLQKRIYDGCGEYGIPILKPLDKLPRDCDFIPFNYAKSCKERSDKGIHFFIDDYQFNRLWSSPDKYIDMLKQFRYVMTPDFSTYTDFPKAIQIYNHYRKHWIGSYMQERGIDVIPTISWSTPDSFNWCFDGEPVNSCVSVSSVGTLNSREKKILFIEGYMEMVARLNPHTIIFYGNVPDGCTGNIIRIPPYSDRFRCMAKDRK